MNSSTTAKGNPEATAADCKAVIASLPVPAAAPANSSTAATTPSVTAQKRRCCQIGFGSPPLVSMSITREPESEEVAKKSTTTMIPSTEARTLRMAWDG